MPGLSARSLTRVCQPCLLMGRSRFYGQLTTTSKDSANKNSYIDNKTSHFMNIHTSPRLFGINPLSSPRYLHQWTKPVRQLPSLIRAISTTPQTSHWHRHSRPPMGNVYGGPFGFGGGPPMMPDWIKLAFVVTIGAFLLVKVALPFMFIVLPPLLIFCFIFNRGNKFWRHRRFNYEQGLLDNSSLIFKPPRMRTRLVVPTPEQVNNEIANFELNRIIDAFWSNEHGIADYFRISSVSNLALGSLEGVHYDYDSNSSVFADDFAMIVSQRRVMYDTSDKRKLATCVINLKCLEPPMFEEGVDPTANIGKCACVIEINPLQFSPKRFIIDTPSSFYNGENNSDDPIIDIKGRTHNI